MGSNSPILTIAIPTYNRAAKLEAQLERLLPQLRPEVCVRVFDNASPDHTREVVAKYLDRGVGYFRAVTNCGAGRNIFRCFEECQTEWLWVLSDDDLARPTAVADLFNLLSSETADFVHTYSWISPYTSDLQVTNLQELFKYSNFSSLMWLTAGLYRTRAFQPWFRVYNEGLSTWAPHLLMVLSLLATEKSRAHLSPVNLTTPPDTPIPWSTLGCLLRLSQLPEQLVRHEHQRLVAERIFLEFFNDFMLMGLRETNGSLSVGRWQRVYRQARQNLKAYGACGVGSHILQNWYRSGLRKKSLRLAKQSACIKLLSWCPVVFFHSLAGLLPLGKNMRDDYYNQRLEHKVYV